MSVPLRHAGDWAQALEIQALEIEAGQLPALEGEE